MFLFVFSNLALYQMGPATASPGEPLSRYTTFTDQLQESMPQFPQECLAGGATPVPDNQQEFFFSRECLAKDSLVTGILAGGAYGSIPMIGEFQ